MAKQLRTTDDYTIFRDVTDEDRVYAVHKDEVENMKRVKTVMLTGLCPIKSL